MNCSYCHETIKSGARFCNGCGRPVGDAERDLADCATEISRPGPPALQGTKSPAATDDSFIGRVLEGKYELLAELGSGGMGTVFRARRIHIGDEVAVKVLHQEYVANEGALERFRREARAAAMLRHQNVVAIYDYGEGTSIDAPAFIVMELVPGRSLREILETAGRLDPGRAVSLMQSICAGVNAGHKRHVVHRDLKPDNIIVLPESDDEKETVRVVDFGIAKLRDLASASTLTQTGTVIGTPYYMSPEQCRADSLDPRSDVYSLGAMMYEMLAGAPPFTAATFTGVVAKHLTEPPPPIPANAAIPAVLERTVMRALDKNPDGRQNDAGVLSRELADAVVSRPDQPARVDSSGSAYSVPIAPTRGAAPPAEPYVPQFSQNQEHPSLHGASALPQRTSRAPLIMALSGLFIAILLTGVFAIWLIGRRGDQGSTQTAGPGLTEPRSSPSPTPGSRGSGTDPGIRQIPERNPDTADSGNASPVETKILRGLRLEVQDLTGFTAPQLRMLRNTIYARHGRAFARPEIQRYFNSKPWYVQRSDYRDSLLTPADQANVRLILSFEPKR